MPADYLACVENYVNKGVSKNTAQARCAAWFYKKHGYPVKDAHSVDELPPIDGAEPGDIDLDLVKLIMSDLSDIDEKAKKGRASKLTKKDKKENITMTKHMKSPVLAANLDMLEDFNIVEIVATKVGAVAYTEEGDAVTWTSEGIDSSLGTWAFNDLSANHEENSFYGKILADYRVGDELRHLVKVTDYMKAWIQKAGDLIGVSIEATDVKIKDYDIVKAKGAGLTFVFPPHEPACDQQEGCGILATDYDILATKDDDTPVGHATFYRFENGKSVEIEKRYITIGEDGIPKILDVVPDIKIDASDNISETNDNSHEPENTGDMMSEDKENIVAKNTICAEKYESDMKAKDSEIEALKEENKSLRANLEKFELDKKEVILKNLTDEGIEAEAYKDDNIATLEKLLSAVRAFKESLKNVKEENSGAKVEATEKQHDDDGDAMTKKMAEEAAKAEAEAKAVEEKLKEIEEKAGSFERGV